MNVLNSKMNLFINTNSSPNNSPKTRSRNKSKTNLLPILGSDKSPIPKSPIRPNKEKKRKLMKNLSYISKSEAKRHENQDSIISENNFSKYEDSHDKTINVFSKDGVKEYDSPLSQLSRKKSR